MWYAAPPTAAARRSGRLLPIMLCLPSLRRRRDVALQRVLQLRLRLLRQRRLEDGSAELAEGLHGLVRSHFLDDQEQRRGARLEHVAHLLLKLAVDPRLLELPHQGAEAGAECEAEDRDEEEQAEEEAPEASPRRAAGHLVVVGDPLVLAFPVADDRRDRVGL